MAEKFVKYNPKTDAVEIAEHFQINDIKAGSKQMVDYLRLCLKVAYYAGRHEQSLEDLEMISK